MQRGRTSWKARVIRTILEDSPIIGRPWLVNRHPIGIRSRLELRNAPSAHLLHLLALSLRAATLRVAFRREAQRPLLSEHPAVEETRFSLDPASATCTSYRAGSFELRRPVANWYVLSTYPDAPDIEHPFLGVADSQVIPVGRQLSEILGP